MIEHKMFSYITMNWRAKLLVSRKTIVKLTANIKTKSGLKIHAALYKNIYEKGIKVSNEDFKKINIFEENFHGEWNYIIKQNSIIPNSLQNQFFFLP